MTDRAPTPGVYKGISREEYDDIPALRSTTAYKMLTTAPAKAIIPTTPTDPMALGTCAHDLMLEGEERFAVNPFGDYRTAEAREWKAEQIAAGIIPQKAESVEKVRAMVLAGKRQIVNLSESYHFGPDGDSELSVVWEDPLGVWCKARFDWKSNSAITDYKTSKGATPNSWERQHLWKGAAFSAAFYLRGASFIWPGQRWEWRWIVQDTEDPYLLFCQGILPAALAEAQRQVNVAIETAAACERVGAYPGYSKFTYWADVPPYVVADTDEKEARDDMENMLK